jgi:hypothetical protein
MRPHEIVSVLVRCDRCSAATTMTAIAVVHPITRSAAVTGRHQQQKT